MKGNTVRMRGEGQLLDISHNMGTQELKMTARQTQGNLDRLLNKLFRSALVPE
jgi:hypothetical protein